MDERGQAGSGAGGRVAVVMAASRGLGYGSAEALARAGHRLVLCARGGEALERAAATLRGTGAQVATVAADVSQPEGLETVFRTADETFGGVDVLVANAGGPPPGSFQKVTEEQWAQAFDLTLMSAVRAIRLALPRMQRNRFGRIVVIGSSSVKQPLENLILSNAFRPALVGIVKSLAVDVAREGITVNIVSPGRVDTDRVRSLDEARAKAKGVPYEEFKAAFEETIPIGRYGSPADLGALVAFLASDAAGYITGQSILVDGGMVAALP